MDNKLYTIINDFIHDTLQPTMQCINSYKELLENPQLNINHKKLIEIFNHILKRCQDVKDGLLDIVNKGGD